MAEHRHPAAWLRTACLQAAGTPGEVETNLAELNDAAARAAAAGANVLVTPEMFLTGYALSPAELDRLTDQPLFEEVCTTARRHSLSIVAGLPRRREDGAVTNCATLIDDNGEIRANHAKAHLYGDLDRNLFHPGDTTATLTTLHGIRVALLVCYDVEFPEATRLAALAGAQVALVPTALMHPYSFVATTLLPARAWENQIYVAYANRIGTEIGTEGELTFVGHSAIYAPDGTALASADATPDLLIADMDTTVVERARAKNPYLRDRREELYGGLSRAGET